LDVFSQDKFTNINTFNIKIIVNIYFGFISNLETCLSGN